MKQISLTQGKVALVDDEDYERVSKMKWHASFHGKEGHEKWYACTTSRDYKNHSSKIRMHRLIMGLEPGDKRVVHHKDDDGLNNQKSNLEIVANNAYNMFYSNGWKGGLPK